MGRGASPTGDDKREEEGGGSGGGRPSGDWQPSGGEDGYFFHVLLNKNIYLE